MDERIFRLKVASLFHDPPIKSLVLRAQNKYGIYVSHKTVAKNIVKELNKKVNIQLKEDMVEDPLVEHSDYVAASSDRTIISELYSNVGEVVCVNILTPNEYVWLNELIDSKVDKERYIRDEFPKEFIKNLFNIPDEQFNALPLHIKYHYIWRSFVDSMVKTINDPKASLLPADTRVPYYTIYDHLYTASGFIPTLTIDPKIGKIGIIHWESIGVQSFIQESRAFRDLWASSFLVSLMNTAVIIRLAKEYGFDSILSPNMLYNPLVDLYLYAHTKDLRLKIKFDDLKIPTTPDKGFAIVPYDMVDEYVKCIPRLFNKLWEEITLVVKHYVENKLKDYNDIYIHSLESWKVEHNIDSKNEKLISTNNFELNWNNIWELCGYTIPINFVCVGERFSLGKKSEDSIEKKMHEWKELYKCIIDDNSIEEVKIFRQIAETKYNPDFQFFEFPIVMDVLKKKRKFVSELPRPNITEWILKDQIHVKDRRLICSICYKRPAVIFASKKVIDELPMIKDNERLCPVCLTKRLLATRNVFLRVINNVLNTIDKADYEEVLEKDILQDYKNDELFSNNNGILLDITKEIKKSNPLLIPSLDTLSTFSTRYSYIKYLDNEDVKELHDIIFNKIAEKNIPQLIINAPYIEWVKYLTKYISRDHKQLLAFVGGEYFIPDELRKEKRYEEKEEHIKELQRIINVIFKEKLKKIKPINDTILSTLPGKYVSVIRADGDNMGKLFSLTDIFSKKIEVVLPQVLQNYLKEDNEKIVDVLDIKVSEIKKLQYKVTPSFYAFVSRALAIIARKIAEMAKDYATVIVYAGGDDILALSPVELSLIFASKARELFSQKLLELHANDTKILVTGLSNAATQSFAIRYFHVFAPLSKELNESNKDLDSKAKEVKGKNGLVIIYDARSGNIVKSILRWDYDSIAERIFNIVSLTLKYKRLSKDRFTRINDIDKPNARLSDTAFRDIIKMINKDYDKDIINTIVESELKRHSNNLLEELMLIITCLDKEAIINGERYPALLEFIKAALAYHNALDSKPLALGVKL